MVPNSLEIGAKERDEVRFSGAEGFPTPGTPPPGIFEPYQWHAAKSSFRTLTLRGMGFAVNALPTVFPAQDMPSRRRN
jgi:hypothetical protein